MTSCCNVSPAESTGLIFLSKEPQPHFQDSFSDFSDTDLENVPGHQAIVGVLLFVSF